MEGEGETGGVNGSVEDYYFEVKVRFVGGESEDGFEEGGGTVR